MKALAPGKLVLSGAYAVLRGAPAVVTAVDRWVVTDSARSAEFEAPEVSEALRLLDAQATPRERGLLRAPYVDASQVRSQGRKLGLGSSAAICVGATWLGASQLSAFAQLSEGEFRDRVFAIALEAHRLAQGGGSGIDVAAACFGGTFVAQRSPGSNRADQGAAEHPPLRISAAALAPELVFEAWAMSESASTKHFVERVFACEESRPAEFARSFEQQCRASERAVRALRSSDSREWVLALTEQLGALEKLGALGGVPIVLPEVRELHELAGDGACFLPSGAGGGDVSVYFGHEASSATFRRRAQQLGAELLPLRPSASGVRTETGEVESFESDPMDEMPTSRFRSDDVVPAPDSERRR